MVKALPALAALVIMVVLGLKPYTAAGADDPVTQRRIIYNNDGSNIFMEKDLVTADDVRKEVDRVVGTQVDTYMISPAAMVSYFPSKTVEWLGDGRPETGSAQFPILARNVKRLVEEGHDPIGLVIDRAKEKGFETFITYRMNDVHDTDLPESILFSSFWKSHPEWRVGAGSWNDATLNYAVPAVQKHMLARLQEVLDRYGDRIDGLELDWQRFPSYFKKGEAERNIPVLTRFTRKVRQMTNDVAKRRGRPLLLSVRVPGTLEKSRQTGLDPVGWAKEGIVDFITVAPFFHMDGDPVKIKEYKTAITNVPVYGCIEAAYNSEHPLTPDDYRKEALQLYEDGAEGIYLFNYFGHIKTDDKNEYHDLLNELGNKDTVQKSE